jgi:hypothetical protein
MSKRGPSRAKQAMEPPPGGITNAECSSVMFYVAKKAELQHEPNKNNVKKFLEDRRRYEELEKALQEGSLQPSDRWDALGVFLNIDIEERPMEQVVVQQLPDDSIQAGPLVGGGVASDASVPRELETQPVLPLPHLEAAGLCGEPTEVAAMLEAGLLTPPVLTGGLVHELALLKLRDPVTCVLRAMGIASVKTRTMDNIVRGCVRQTGEMAAQGEAGEAEREWSFAPRVRAAALEEAAHPLHSLITSLQAVRDLGTACLSCSTGTSKHYCRQCLVATYCSNDCMRQHWDNGGHREECGDVASRLHGFAGLQPPLIDPNPNPELHAERMRARRAQARTTSAMVYLQAALGERDTAREKEQLLKEKLQEYKEETLRLGSLS